jgi:hypothetical protein
MLSAGMCVVNLTKRLRVATVPTSGDLAVTTLAEVNMDITQLKDWIAVVTGCFAVVGGWIALVTYRGNLRLKRAEWMEKLHSKFYESPNYKRIRRILDYRCEPDYELAAGDPWHEGRRRLVRVFRGLLELFRVHREPMEASSTIASRNPHAF